MTKTTLLIFHLDLAPGPLSLPATKLLGLACLLARTLLLALPRPLTDPASLLHLDALVHAACTTYSDAHHPLPTLAATGQASPTPAPSPQPLEPASCFSPAAQGGLLARWPGVGGPSPSPRLVVLLLDAALPLHQGSLLQPDETYRSLLDLQLRSVLAVSQPAEPGPAQARLQPTPASSSGKPSGQLGAMGPGMVEEQGAAAAGSSSRLHYSLPQLSQTLQHLFPDREALPVPPALAPVTLPLLPPRPGLVLPAAPRGSGRAPALQRASGQKLVVGGGLSQGFMEALQVLRCHVLGLPAHPPSHPTPPAAPTTGHPAWQEGQQAVGEPGSLPLPQSCSHSSPSLRSALSAAHPAPHHHDQQQQQQQAPHHHRSQPSIRFVDEPGGGWSQRSSLVGQQQGQGECSPDHASHASHASHANQECQDLSPSQPSSQSQVADVVLGQISRVASHTGDLPLLPPSATLRKPSSCLLTLGPTPPGMGSESGLAQAKAQVGSEEMMASSMQAMHASCKRMRGRVLTAGLAASVVRAYVELCNEGVVAQPPAPSPSFSHSQAGEAKELGRGWGGKGHGRAVEGGGHSSLPSLAAVMLMVVDGECMHAMEQGYQGYMASMRTAEVASGQPQTVLLVHAAALIAAKKAYLRRTSHLCDEAVAVQCLRQLVTRCEAHCKQLVDQALQPPACTAAPTLCSPSNPNGPSPGPHGHKPNRFSAFPSGPLPSMAHSSTMGSSVAGCVGREGVASTEQSSLTRSAIGIGSGTYPEALLSLEDTDQQSDVYPSPNPSARQLLFHGSCDRGGDWAESGLALGQGGGREGGWGGHAGGGEREGGGLEEGVGSRQLTTSFARKGGQGLAKGLRRESSGVASRVLSGVVTARSWARTRKAQASHDMHACNLLSMNRRAGEGDSQPRDKEGAADEAPGGEAGARGASWLRSRPKDTKDVGWGTERLASILSRRLDEDTRPTAYVGHFPPGTPLITYPPTMYPIFRKPQSGRLPTTAEHPSQNNHIASQRSVTTSADDEGVESVASDDDADLEKNGPAKSKVKKGSSDGAWVSKQKYGITDSMRKDHGHWIKPILGSPDRVSCRFCLHPQSIQARKATVDTHAASIKHSNAVKAAGLCPGGRPFGTLPLSPAALPLSPAGTARVDKIAMRHAKQQLSAVEAAGSRVMTLELSYAQAAADPETLQRFVTLVYLLMHGRPLVEYEQSRELLQALNVPGTSSHWSRRSAIGMLAGINQALEDELVHTVKTSEFISLSMDESTGVDGKGYMCIFMHSMDRDFVRQATFVDLPPVNGATADDLLDLLLATVGSKLQLSMEQLGSKLVSFGCDGASVLQGAHTGVVVQLRTKVAPFVQGVWCHAHRGQLAGKAIEDTPVISKLNNLSSTLAHYFCRSPKRQGELRAISRPPRRQQSDSPLVMDFIWGEQENLSLLCGTVWHKAMLKPPRRGRQAAACPVDEAALLIARGSVEKQLTSAALSLTADLESRFPPSEQLSAFALLTPSYWWDTKAPSQADQKAKLQALTECYAEPKALAAAPFSHSPLSPMLDSVKLYQQLGSFQVAARGVARAMKAQLDDMRRRAAKRKPGTRQEESDSDDSHGSDNGGYDAQEQRTPLLSEFWKKLHASMASQLSEFCKAATLLIVTVPGSVEEERSFSAMNFIKDERRNRLGANLSSTLRVYLDKTFTLKTFPYKEAIDYWMAGASARGRYLGHSG
ncbi:hypothetical protein QJQ45_023657 [Haematococcus lacustris]|nr:hypothetical protein QJQ45_023657 [Haematococcus lacustris]